MSIFSCTESAVRYRNKQCKVTDSGENAGIRYFALVKKGNLESLDRTSPATYSAGLKALELSCDAIIFRETAGSKADNTRVDGKPRGAQASRLTGKTQSIVVNDFDYFIGSGEESNVKLWQQLENNALLYDLVYMTETLAHEVIGKDLDIFVNDAFGEENTTEIEPAITVSWSDKENPCSYKYDKTDLACDSELVFDSYTVVAPVTNVDDTLTCPVDGAFDATVTFTGATSYEIFTDTPLPSWLSLNESTGQLTGTAPSVAETTVIVLCGINSCGVQGCKEITISIV